LVISLYLTDMYQGDELINKTNIGQTINDDKKMMIKMMFFYIQ